VLIAGPTASGKSALALTLADRLQGTIINADSMQVYRDLRIITARPDAADETRVPHRLYGHIGAAESYSVGRWLVEARRALDDAAQEQRLPFLVGGTGLYFKSLTQGLAGIPPIPAEVRSHIRDRLRAEGAVALHAELQDRDPAGAQRIRPNDKVRIARALEVVLATGRTLGDWHRVAMTPVLDPATTVRIFLSVDRQELYARIDRRFDAMLASGAIDEVRVLWQRRLDPTSPAMKAHGVPWLIRYLQGEISLDAAAEEAKRDTRRYTKRQATWFRHQLPDWTWAAPDSALDAIRRALGC
jgi:tRNA dimethylallyltransferase